VGPRLPATTPRVPPIRENQARRGRKASPTNEAAVDDQVDACAEGRRLAGQKDGGLDQLIDGCHAAERSVGLEFFRLAPPPPDANSSAWPYNRG